MSSREVQRLKQSRKSSHTRPNSQEKALAVGPNQLLGSRLDRPRNASIRVRSVSVHTPRDISGVSQAQAKKLYKARCRDLNIAVVLSKESKFLAACSEYFACRRFKLKGMGLG